MTDTPKSERPKSTDRQAKVRLYVGAGVVFWIVAALVAYGRGASTGTIIALALLAFVIAAALVVSWFHEPTGAVIMLAAAVSMIAYGLLSRWDWTLWAMMFVAAIGPALLGAYLFDAARRDSESERESAAPTP